MAKYMTEQYPDNPFFERYYARSAFVRGRLNEAEVASKHILEKIGRSQAGYEAVSGRTAAYILAYINHNFYHNSALAKQYYQQSIDFAKQIDATNAGYYWSSLIGLAKIATEEKNYDQANAYYKQVMDSADKKSSQYEEAKKALKDSKKSRRDERRKRNG
jgi:tetratricopeptide (TPR) repeat protein